MSAKEMNETQVNLTEETLISRGPGVRLKRMRNLANATVEQVAHELRLSPQVIINLENDNYNHFAGHTFIKGYLRSYARLLGLPEDEIIASFNGLNLVESSSDKPRLELPQRRVPSEHKLNVGWLTFVGLILLITVGIYWWYNHHHFDKANFDSVITTTIDTPANEVPQINTMEAPLANLQPPLDYTPRNAKLSNAPPLSSADLKNKTKKSEDDSEEDDE